MEGEFPKNKGKWINSKDIGKGKSTPHPTPKHEMCSNSTLECERNLLDFSDNNSNERGETFIKTIVNEYSSNPSMQAIQKREKDRIQRHNFSARHARAKGYITPNPHTYTPIPNNFLTGDAYSHDPLPFQAKNVVSSDLENLIL